MGKEILKCQKCKTYTLKKVHCNKETIQIKPAKFSLEKEERIGKYRRQYKHGMENNKDR